MMTNIAKRLHGQLVKRKQNGILRSLKHKPGLVDFTSNDYLGLAGNQDLSQRIIGRLQANTHRNGAGGSRLLSGHTPLVEQLETRLADIFQGEAALFFNSGYTANLALMSSLPQRGDTVLYDEYAHACIKDGVRLSLARHFSFRHNDLDDLERQLKKAEGQKFVVIESLYSMDGDWAHLDAITKLCEHYQAQIILDEAHSTAWFGPQGRGMACSMGVKPVLLARVYTFGKALGVHGACVVADQVIIDYLINFARPFIYTTALPDSSLIAVDEAWTYLWENPQLVQQLESNIAHFQEEYQSLFETGANQGPIQKIVLGDVPKLKALSSSLEQSGFDLRAIFSPTVATGSERLRVCLHAFNQPQEISAIFNIIKSLI